eukprot:3796417-Ditylum_brightwellii.AAC.1
MRHAIRLAFRVNDFNSPKAVTRNVPQVLRTWKTLISNDEKIPMIWETQHTRGDVLSLLEEFLLGAALPVKD